jgi:hypothetical protein
MELWCIFWHHFHFLLSNIFLCGAARRRLGMDPKIWTCCLSTSGCSLHKSHFWFDFKNVKIQRKVKKLITFIPCLNRFIIHQEGKRELTQNLFCPPVPFVRSWCFAVTQDDAVTTLCILAPVWSILSHPRPESESEQNISTDSSEQSKRTSSERFTYASFHPPGESFQTMSSSDEKNLYPFLPVWYSNWRNPERIPWCQWWWSDSVFSTAFEIRGADLSFFTQGKNLWKLFLNIFKYFLKNWKTTFF